MASICSRIFTIEVVTSALCLFGFGTSPENSSRPTQSVAIENPGDDTTAVVSIPFAYYVGSNPNPAHANAGFFIEPVASYPAGITLTGTFTPAVPDWAGDALAVKTGSWEGVFTIASTYTGGDTTVDTRIGLNTGM